MGFRDIKYDIPVCHECQESHGMSSHSTGPPIQLVNWSPNTGQFVDEVSGGPLDAIFQFFLLCLSVQVWLFDHLFRPAGALLVYCCLLPPPSARHFLAQPDLSAQNSIQPSRYSKSINMMYF